MRRLAVPTALLVAVAVLLVAGRGDLAAPPLDAGGFGDWVEERGAVVAAVALLRVGALAVAAWLATVTLLAAVAPARLAAVADRALPAPLRRALTGLAGAGMASAVVLGGAGGAAADGDRAAAVAAAEPLVLLPAEGDGTATMSVLPDEEPASSAPAPADEWVVAPGDSFWSIAEETVGAALGRPAGDAEIDPYWRALVDANRDRLVSPNPDLIHPGQVFVLPPF